MYSHYRINQLLAAFALGELDEPQREDVEKHLEECVQCRNELKHIQKLLEAVNEIKNIYADDKLSEFAKADVLEVIATIKQEPALPKRIQKISLWRAIMRNSITKIAAAAVIIIAIFIAVSYLTSQPQEEQKNIVKKQPGSKPEQKIVKDANSEKLEAELKLARELFEAKNVKGLIALLDSDFEQTRLAAANYLAQIGDNEAMKKLESLAQNYANSTQRQIFANAAKEIRAQIEEKQITPVKNDVNQTAIGKTEPEDKDNLQEGVIGIKVLDKQGGEPLAGAALKIRMRGVSSEIEETTNKFGRLELEYGRTAPDYLEIIISKDGFTPKRLYFRPKETGTEIPKNYLVKMEKGIKISGIVQTIDRQNVPDANVKVNIYQQNEDIEQYYVSNVLCKTDSEGKWSYDAFPPNCSEINLRVEHPQYLDTEKYGKNVQIEPLTKGDFVLYVRKPLTISGWVVDKSGKPVAGAKLFEGTHRYSESPQTQTDKQGHFIFDKMYPGETIITAEAKSFAPDMKSVNLKENMDDLQFVLESGNTIFVQVTDPNGKPLDGVNITAREWRKFNDWQQNENISLSGKTDSQGNLVINDAPSDEVIFSIYKAGYARYDKFPMSPQESEYQITLLPQGKITGRVLDAQTGQPINHFYVTQGIQWKGQNEPTWQSQSGKLVNSSVYEMSIGYQDCPIAVKIEADGYNSTETPVFNNEGKEEIYDIYLQKGQTLTGLAFLADGKPAEGAEVIVATKEQGVSIHSIPYGRKYNNIYAMTDSLGKFTLPTIDATYKLVILHQQGINFVTQQQFEENSQIVLEPWGTIEGNVCTSDSSKSNLQIRLDSSYINVGDEPPISLSFNTYPASDGKFYFDKVKAGTVQISKGIKLEDGKTTKYVNEQICEVKAGQITNVEFPCGSRKVTGKIILSSFDSQLDFQNQSISLRSDIDLSQIDFLPSIDFPVDYLCWNKEQRQQFQKQIMESEEFKSYLEKSREFQKMMLKSYDSANINKDGSFTFPDVLPGSYVLTAEFWNKETKKLLAVLDSRVNLPESKDPSEYNIPLDLGALQPTPSKTAETGNTAPDFELDSLGGGKINLSSLKGKFVLLDFGGPFNNEEYAQNVLPNLQKAYETFEKNGNFVIITISPAYYGKQYNLTKQIEFFRDKNALKWQFALTKVQNEFSRLQVHIDYNYSYGTKFVLIGPDGKIVEQDFTPEKLMETIEKYLKPE